MIRSVRYARVASRIRRRPPPFPSHRSSYISISFFTASSSSKSPPSTPPDDADDQKRRRKNDDDDNDTATIIRGPSLLSSTGVHRPSPSLFHLPGLRSLPFWTAPHSMPPPPRGGGGRGRGREEREEEREEEDLRHRRQPSRHRIAFNDPVVSSIVSRLEEGYDDIKSEYLEAVLGLGHAAANDGDVDDDIARGRRSPPLVPDYDASSGGVEHKNDVANALHVGSWDWHSCMQNGRRGDVFRDRCPRTSAIVDDLEGDGALFGTPFGFSFFSTLHPRSYIRPHTGPMNLRLRIHLPLLVPRDDEDSGIGVSISRGRRRDRPLAGIRVADQVREWQEGSAVVLDDSYVHEAWNDSDDQCRVVFLLDVWHPDVRIEERDRINGMFDYARDRGWIGSSGGGLSGGGGGGGE
ncbi:hypothetical protein ACHAXA_006187 [Cyclostephanos tholiformis]|uniref:Aspartyl/asparaginy/proline hydroxylase domain-containing protein n=1 Tax=Cyclostephanos tholiformis TaxID=382380 RepID=A0ABD3RED6_9STRA